GSTSSAPPATVTPDGSATSSLTATLLDAYAHPVPGNAVSLRQGSASSTITTLSGTTGAAGHATFRVTDTVAETVTYTAHDTTDSIVVSPTADVQFVAGPVSAAQSTVSASPASVVADGSTTSTVTVTLRDAQSNPV